MRYMASQFKNEIDVLKIRLDTLGDHVDVVVLAEATVDQRGRPKDLILPDLLPLYQASCPAEIRYVAIKDMPGGITHEDDTRRERWQRDALLRGMPELKSDDIVYVSDLDEIPYPDQLEAAFKHGLPVRFAMDLFVYALNWRWLERGCRIGTLGCVLPGDNLLRLGVCGAVLWDSSVQGLPGPRGWHLTYQGGVEAIRSKITGMMDKAADLVMPGVDPEEILSDEWILESIRTGRDIFGRTYRPTEWVGLDSLPPCVQADPHRYAHMMVPRPHNQDEIEAQPRCTCGGVWLDGVAIPAQRQLGHFGYCALAALPDTLLHPDDMRSRPRARDV